MNRASELLNIVVMLHPLLIISGVIMTHRAMLRRARYCYGKSSVRLSVRDAEVS